MPSQSPLPRWRVEFWPRTAAVIWILVCLGIAIQAYLKPRGHTLFDIYSNGIHAWWAGEELYARQPDTHEFYRYSQAFAVVTGPLAALPPGAGNAAWKMTNAAVFALGLWVWSRRGTPWAPSADRIAGVFLFALPLAAGNLYNGQANLMMTGLVLLGLTAVARDRWWWAAGFLAAATLIKVFPLALALVLGVLFWRTFPVRYVAAVFAGLVLPFASLRVGYVWAQLVEWGKHLAASNELNRERLRSLDRLLEVHGVSLPSATFTAIAAVAGLVVLAVGVLEMWRGSSRPVVLFRVGAWFMAWVVLFSPSTENATFSLLTPFVAWAIAEAIQRPRTWATRVWLIVSLYLMGLSTSDAGGPLRHFFHTHCATTAGAVMFQAWLLIDLLRRRGVESPAVAAQPAPTEAVTSSRRAA